MGQKVNPVGLRLESTGDGTLYGMLRKKILEVT